MPLTRSTEFSSSNITDHLSLVWTKENIIDEEKHKTEFIVTLSNDKECV